MRIPLLFLCFCAIISCGRQASRKEIQNIGSFAGNWQFQKDSSIDFNLSLFTKGDSVTGMHCSIMLFGNRMDCSEGSISIRGLKKGNTAKVNFKSYYGNGIGEAILTLKNNSCIIWHISKAPSGMYFIPVNAIMKREVK